MTEIISCNIYSLFNFHVFCSGLAHARSTLGPTPEPHFRARRLLCFSAAFFPLQRQKHQQKVPAITAPIFNRGTAQLSTLPKKQVAQHLTGGEGRNQLQQFLCGRYLVLPASRPASHVTRWLVLTSRGASEGPEVPPAPQHPSMQRQLQLCLLTGNSSWVRASAAILPRRRRLARELFSRFKSKTEGRMKHWIVHRQPGSQMNFGLVGLVLSVPAAGCLTQYLASEKGAKSPAGAAGRWTVG